MNTHTLPLPKALPRALTKALLPKTAPRAAFGKIVLNEARLAWRLPAGLIFTPLGASVEAMQDSMQGQFPPAEPLLVLVGYALVFAFIAKRFLRWE